MIPVTKPFLPPKEDFQEYLDQIWSRNWLTNNGPLVNEFELVLKDYFQLDHALFVANGTLALQIAIKALDLKGEFITTPFSYVATTSAAVWEGLSPIYVDIDPNTLNIDPQKIEAAISSDTSAIIACHVYGNPCDIEAIQRIANKYSLKVIYDAAHCFGSSYKSKSVFSFGDITTTSFHATKLFHTIEGGAVFTNNPELLRKMALLRNFGHTGPNTFESVGINAKNCEFRAAMGLANFKYVDQILARRKRQWLYYHNILQNFQAGRIKIEDEASYNYGYYPIIFEDTNRMKACVEYLNRNYVFPRRYFHPTLSKLPYVRNQETPIADKISSGVICLPLYYDLTNEEQKMIGRYLLRFQNY